MAVFSSNIHMRYIFENHQIQRVVQIGFLRHKLCGPNNVDTFVSRTCLTMSCQCIMPLDRLICPPGKTRIQVRYFFPVFYYAIFLFYFLDGFQ